MTKYNLLITTFLYILNLSALSALTTTYHKASTSPAFPNTAIFVLKINYSHTMPLADRINLDILNGLIGHRQHVPLLPSSQFHS